MSLTAHLHHNLRFQIFSSHQIVASLWLWKGQMHLNTKPFLHRTLRSWSEMTPALRLLMTYSLPVVFDSISRRFLLLRCKLIHEIAQIILCFILLLFPKISQIIQHLRHWDFVWSFVWSCCHFFILLVLNCEQIKHLRCVHGCKTWVLLCDHCVCNIKFEFLQPTG